MAEKRVNPAAMQVALLDEVAQRLLELQKLLEKPLGIIEPLRPIRATTSPQVIQPPMKKRWFSLSIVNDGPDDCWVTVNTEKSPAQPYRNRAGEEYQVDMGCAAIEDIRVYTESGTANLRIKGVR